MPPSSSHLAQLASYLRAAGLAEVTDRTCTAGFALDVSRLGEAALASDDQASTYNAVQIGNPRHAEDALILLTAQREGIPIVTSETKHLHSACLRRGIEVMTSRELIERVMLLDVALAEGRSAHLASPRGILPAEEISS